MLIKCLSIITTLYTTVQEAGREASGVAVVSTVVITVIALSVQTDMHILHIVETGKLLILLCRYNQASQCGTLLEPSEVLSSNHNFSSEIKCQVMNEIN